MSDTKENTGLWGALSSAQGQFTTAKLDAVNPFFGSRYATHASLLAATVPSLARHGLAVSQSAAVEFMEIRGEARPVMRVRTTIAHEGGETHATEYICPAYRQDKRGMTWDNHTTAAAATYGRRVAYGAILNVSIGDDTDGNETVEPPDTVPPKSKSKSKSKSKPKGIDLPEFVTMLDECSTLAEVAKVAKVGAGLPDCHKDEGRAAVRWRRGQIKKQKENKQ